MIHLKKLWYFLPFCAISLAFLSGCNNAKKYPMAAYTSPSPYYKVGKPYKIKGTWYYPKIDPTYDEVGMASWYGPGFEQNKTANGEVFCSSEMTAAHPTLPLPSIVMVTNLSNKRSVLVKVNDRGPFRHKRIIDVSKRVAEILGFKDKGVTKVRVQFMQDHTVRMLASMSNKTHYATFIPSFDTPEKEGKIKNLYDTESKKNEKKPTTKNFAHLKPTHHVPVNNRR